MSAYPGPPPAGPRPNPRKGPGTRALLIALGIAVLLFFVVRQFWQTSGFTFIPKELQVTYMPADFKPALDEAEMMRILDDPAANRAEFDQMVMDFNMSIMQHVANRMGLSDTLRPRIAAEYGKHHDYLKDLYFNDFTQLVDTSARLYEQWYDNGSSLAVASFNEVASKYTCFLVNQIIMAVVPTREGMLAVKGESVDTPCGLAMTEALRPLVERLQERAVVADFSRSRGMMQEKVTRNIAELATIEVRDKKGLSREMKTRIWGYAVSSTELEISAISIMKVGFRLNDYFDISVNQADKTLIISMPEPEILSHEVYPKVDKLDVGWLREVASADFNNNFNLLRQEFRRETLESDVMQQARNKAKELMGMMYGPLLQSMDRRYKLAIRFKDLSAAPPAPSPASQSDTENSAKATTAKGKADKPQATSKPRNELLEELEEIPY